MECPIEQYIRGNQKSTTSDNLVVTMTTANAANKDSVSLWRPFDFNTHVGRTINETLYPQEKDYSEVA